MEPRGRDGEPLRPRDVHDRRAPGHRQLEGAIRRGPHTERRARRLPPGGRPGVSLWQGRHAFVVGLWQGNVDTTVYGLTPTLTWYGANGVYVDVQAQANWFDSDLKSRSAGKLRNGAKAHGRLGIEAGKAWDLRQGLALIPQAQLTYLSTRFGSFNDRFDARIESDKGDSLQGRVGIALDYKRDWQSGGVHREASVYGVANVKHEFLDGTRVRVANVPVASRMARTWGGLGLGVNYGWGGRYALYSQIDADADFSGSHVVTATVGFRMMF